MMILKMAFRNVFRHRIRSLITMCAISFGVVALIFAGGFFEDVLVKVRESYIRCNVGHLQIHRKGFDEHGRKEPFDYLIENPEEIMTLLRTIPKISLIEPRLGGGGILSTGETTIPCFIQGVDPLRSKSVQLNPSKELKNTPTPSEVGIIIEKGRGLSTDRPFGAILGKGLAKSIGAQVGDDLIFVTRTVNESINGIDVKVEGIFYSGSKDFDDHHLRLPLSTMKYLMRTPAIKSLIVSLEHTEDTLRVEQDLKYLIQTHQLDIEVKRWDQINDFYTKTKLLFSRMFLVLKLVISIIVILSITNMMNVVVRERVSEIGTIMAMGTQPSDVLKLFLCEGAFLGLFGGLLGVGMGCLITWLIGTIGIPMPPPPGATMAYLQRPVIVPAVVGFSFVLSIVTSLFSALFPAWSASRLEIAHILRQAN